MRKITTLKVLLILFVLFLSSTKSTAQLLVENFDYTVGSALTANGWTAHSGGGTSPILVTSGLSFSGYAGNNIGGAANVSNNGEDLNRTFTEQSSGNIYISFIIKTEASNSAGYFFNLGQSTIGTTFYSRVWVNGTGDGIGLTSGSTAPSSYSTITAGTPTLLVLKHDFTANTSELFILNSFSATEPSSATISISETFTKVGSIALRQYNASQKIVVDGIRVGTTWAAACAPESTSPKVSTPTYTILPGNVYSTQNVGIETSTSGAQIYYTTDGSTPTASSTLYTTPISVSSTTTIKAIAIKSGMEASSVASATYTFPTEVANIAALRALTLPAFAKLTGEAVLTLKSATRNAKYIQDATAAILIDDPNGVITTSYNLGDGITGIIGTLATFNSMLQFTPVTNTGTASSSSNVVTPTVVTLDELTNHQAKLVKVKGITIPQQATLLHKNHIQLQDQLLRLLELNTQI